MSIYVRNAEEAARAIVQQWNAKLRDEAKNVNSFPHADITSTQSGDYTDPVLSPLLVTAATASSLATGIAIANDAMHVFDFHCADTFAHSSADDANPLGLDDLEDDATQGALDTRLNLLKVAFLAHVHETDVHYTDDATNTIASPDATNLGTSETLANEIKSSLNAHTIFAPAAALINFGPA